MFAHHIDEKLKLVLPQPHIAETMTAAVRENLARLKPWMPWATEDYSVELCRQWIQRTLNEFAQDGRFNAVIFFDGYVAGSIGIHNLDTTNKSAEIGYWIAKEFEGRGLVTRCCQVLIDYMFDVMELNRVQINCNVENTRSRAVPERLGFRLEGVHRQVEFLHDRFGDWAVYAMLKDEWKNGLKIEDRS